MVLVPIGATSAKPLSSTTSEPTLDTWHAAVRAATAKSAGTSADPVPPPLAQKIQSDQEKIRSDQEPIQRDQAQIASLGQQISHLRGLAVAKERRSLGIFGSNGAGVPAADRGFLKGLSEGIDTELYGIGGQNNKGPATGVIRPNTQYDIQQYLAGKVGNGKESSSQRLANLMSVLGPNRTYAVLANMAPAQAQQLGIQSSLSTLTNNSQFTARDAKDLALAQANLATSESQYDLPGIGSVGSFMNSLPNDQKGAAVKVGYAQGCISGAQQLSQELGSGKYSGQVQNQLTATLNGLLENATNLSAGFSDRVKEQLFSQLHTAATQLAGTGDAKQSDVLNAYAANILGSLKDKSRVATTLRAIDLPRSIVVVLPGLVIGHGDHGVPVLGRASGELGGRFLEAIGRTDADCFRGSKISN
jgi:hypothetical protein